MRSTGIIIISVIVVFLMLSVQSSQAVEILGNTTGSSEWPNWRGYFEGEFAYEYTSPSKATLIVSLTNKSPIDNHGFLTAFAFNIPLGYISGVSFSENDEHLDKNGNKFDWNLLLGTYFTTVPNEISAPPFGKDFDIGASVGTKWTGTGRAEDGIPVTNTVFFTFGLVGTDLDALTDQSFVDSTPSGGEFFVTRFRGFDDGGSDKIPATPIPEPATMILLGSGLVGLAAFGRANRKRRL